MNRGMPRIARTHLARAADRLPTANDDLLRRRIEEVEHALLREDPAFVKRMRRLQRIETMHGLTVFAFLAVGAIVMTVGLATASVIAIPLGIATMLGGCLVDVFHRRMLRRWSREGDAR